MVLNMFTASALFISTIEALASKTDETTTTEVITTISATSTSTPPEGTVCRRQDYRTTNKGFVGLGSAGTVTALIPVVWMHLDV